MVITSGGHGGAQEHLSDIVNSLKNKYRFFCISGEGGNLPKKMSELGVDHYVLPQLSREISFSKDLKSYFTLLKLVKRLRPNLIHAHTSKAGALCKLNKIFFPRIPIIYTPHNWSFNPINSTGSHKLNLIIEVFSNFFVSKIICVSNAEFEIAQPYPFKDKIIIIPNWTPSNIQLKNIPRDNPRIFLWVGRLEEPKLPELAIKGFLNLPKEILLDSKLLVVGEGAMKNALVNNYKNCLNIEFSNFLPRESILKLMSESSILLLTSKWESFGLVALEAMQQGLPVISSNVGGLKELIITNESGILIQNTVNELTDEMLKLITNQKFREHISKNAQARALRFSKAKLIESLDHLYSNEISTKSFH